MKTLQKHTSLLLIALAIAACGSNERAKPKVTDAEKASMQNTIDSLKNVVKSSDAPSRDEATKKLISEMLQYTKTYSKDSLAPKYLYTCAELYEKQYGNFNEAFGLYNSIYNDYPESRLASYALFMQGLLMQQYFQKDDKAIYYLDEFIKKYPKHPWNKMAREMLTTQGMDGEEILRNNKPQMR